MPEFVSVSISLKTGVKLVLNTPEISAYESRHGLSVTGYADPGDVDGQDVESVSFLQTKYASSDYRWMRIFRKPAGFEIVGVR